MSEHGLEQLVVFHGELNPQRAYVYLRLDGDDRLSSLSLQGRMTGPRSALTRTLPATVAFHDLGPGPCKLAQAILPDPCYWSPGEPYLYDIHVELVNDTEVVAETNRTVGLRMFGVRERQFQLEAHPWQLFGAAEESIVNAPWAAWREHQMVRMVHSPTDQRCEEASEEGVMLIAHCDGTTPPGIEHEVRRLSRYAAVAIVALPTQAAVSHVARSLAPTILFAQSCRDDAPAPPVPWADLMIVRVRDADTLPRALSECNRPVLLQQSIDKRVSLAQARELCQQLSDRAGPTERLGGCLVASSS